MELVRMEKKFVKYMDTDGKIMYKENGFNFDNNRLSNMDISLKEL